VSISYNETILEDLPKLRTADPTLELILEVDNSVILHTISDTDIIPYINLLIEVIDLSVPNLRT
jgi:hypothetical protein